MWWGNVRLWWDDTVGPKSKNRYSFWSLIQEYKLLEKKKGKKIKNFK